MLPDIVEEHFDELDFLWEHREANVFTADWRLANLAFHEDRCEAHLDGLRLTELHGRDLAAARLTGGTMGAALAATLVLCDTAPTVDLERLVEALRKADEPVQDGIRRALRHSLPAPLRSPLRDLLSHEDPLRAATAADVLAFHGDFELPLERLLAAPEAGVAMLAFGIAARAQRLDEARVRTGSEHAEPAVRAAALRAAAHVGLPALTTLCRAAAGRDTDPDPEALRMLGALGDPGDAALLRSALQRPELAATAIAAIGALGRPETVPLLLDLMTDGKLGPAAARAYLRITGVDVSGEKPFPPAPVAEGEDENEELPADPAKARADWLPRSKLLVAGQSWQDGQAMPAAQLPEAFDRLHLATRRDVVTRLRSRRCQLPNLELEARALLQRR